MTVSYTPEGYYSQVVPQQVADAIADAPAEVVDQPVLTSTYEVTGEGGGVYGVRIANGQAEFVAGGIPNSDIHTTVSVENWRFAADSGEPEPIARYTHGNKIQLVKGLKGTVQLELERPDGGTFESTTVFGGQADPAVTLRMTTDNYAAMMRGDLNGQMAFLTGKLKFEGSLPLLMQLGALNS